MFQRRFGLPCQIIQGYIKSIRNAFNELETGSSNSMLNMTQRVYGNIEFFSKLLSSQPAKLPCSLDSLAHDLHFRTHLVFPYLFCTLSQYRGIPEIQKWPVLYFCIKSVRTVSRATRVYSKTYTQFLSSACHVLIYVWHLRNADADQAPYSGHIRPACPYFIRRQICRLPFHSSSFV